VCVGVWPAGRRLFLLGDEMTKEEILKMAREAGFNFGHPFGIKELEAFAALVAAAEREACAKLVVGLFDPEDAVAEFIAEAICARGIGHD